MPHAPLGIRDYLEASSDASTRTRMIIIVLTVASVLAFMGLLNSIQSQWMHRRMLLLGDIHASYTASKLGPYPTEAAYKTSDEYKHAIEQYERRYYELCAAVERAYVEGSFVIRVPFLGFTFDVNDLGLIAGLGFLVILGCYRFFLSREVDNLRLSFEEAQKIGKRETREFYTLLAMRQVFTVPETGYIKKSGFLIHTPKLLAWLPFMVYIAISAHDTLTAGIGLALQETRFQVLTFCEVATSISLLWFSTSITTRLRRMDNEWHEWWTYINLPEKHSEPTSVHA